MIWIGIKNRYTYFGDAVILYEPFFFFRLLRMEVKYEKIIAAAIILVLSMVFGYLPLLLARRQDNMLVIKKFNLFFDVIFIDKLPKTGTYINNQNLKVSMFCLL